MALALASAAPASAKGAGGGLFLLTPSLDAPRDGNATGDAIHIDVASGITKVEAGDYFEIDVDNGWVIYQGTGGKPALSFYNAAIPTQGSLALVPASQYSLANGNLYFGGGIVFAPCLPAAKNRCGASLDGVDGVGLGFGDISNGGASVSGWTNDDDLKAYPTNPDSDPGSIAALAVSATNGAYAVGWDFAATGSAQAIAVKLDSSGQTYAPVSQTNLGTLGGASSQAFAISRGRDLYRRCRRDDGAEISRRLCAHRRPRRGLRAAHERRRLDLLDRPVRRDRRGGGAGHGHQKQRSRRERCGLYRRNLRRDGDAVCGNGGRTQDAGRDRLRL